MWDTGPVNNNVEMVSKSRTDSLGLYCDRGGLCLAAVVEEDHGLCGAIANAVQELRIPHHIRAYCVLGRGDWSLQTLHQSKADVNGLPEGRAQWGASEELLADRLARAVVSSAKLSVCEHPRGQRQALRHHTQ
jgi:hypothetical protein